MMTEIVPTLSRLAGGQQHWAQPGVPWDLGLTGHLWVPGRLLRHLWGQGGQANSCRCGNGYLNCNAVRYANGEAAVS